MKIAVFGLGYVGVTAAACLASQGHDVIGIDVSEFKASEVNSGRSPIHEPGLDDLIASSVRNGRLHCVTSCVDVMDDVDLAIVCVGTPSSPDGSHNMGFIADVSRQIALAISPQRTKPLTIAYRSTIRPGTIEGLILPIITRNLATKPDLVNVVYNPEFLREASAIKDYFNPPKIVIGTSDGLANLQMDEIHRGLTAPIFYTQYREAEFTKFVDNSFHALKVSFANEIGRLCVEMGISATKVHEIFVSDTKLNISPYYLRPGGAFGGSCLPKDVRALQHISSEVGGNTHLIDALMRSNDAHKHFLFDLVRRKIGPSGRILLIGLAFKKDSDDLRESPKLDLARKLLNVGYELDIFDPGIRVESLVGQNLGYTHMHLPELSKLLVSQLDIEARKYDVVIDTFEMALSLKLNTTNLLNFNQLS